MNPMISAEGLPVRCATYNTERADTNDETNAVYLPEHVAADKSCYVSAAVTLCVLSSYTVSAVHT